VEVFVLKKQLTIFMVILVAAVSWAAAESGYPPILISTYGIPTNSKLNSCTTCHSSVPARNAYGIQLENAGSNSDLLAAFAATDTLDADFDGARNWVELVNGTWPADPSDFVPVEQTSWGRIKALYN
jgi:hypothetical protein